MRRLRVVILPLVVVCFLLVGCFTVLGQTTEPKLISMGGSGWSLTVDKQPLSVDVKSVATVAAAKDMQGAKELSLVLNSLDECKSGVVEFKVDTVGLSCYKQLALTEQEIKDGAVRPDNVVNSYACFDGSGRKVLHIYASRLIDAKGNSVWVDQNLTKGVLTVYLNQTWLKDAVFPVVLDPTFGYLTVGGTAIYGQQTKAYLSYFSLPAAGYISELSVYCDSAVSTVFDVGVYNGTTLVEHHVGTLNNVSAWQHVFFADLLYNAGTYGLAFKQMGYEQNMYYDTVEGDIARIDASGLLLGDDLPTTFTETYTDYYSISIFANYSAYVAPTPTPTVAPAVTPAPMFGFGFDVNWLVFAFVVFGAVLCIIPARIFVVRVVVGMFGIVLAVTQLQNSGLWFYPWSLVLWLFMSVCVLYSIWARTD